MAKFVGDSECCAESIVLADAAAPVWITHCSQFCKALKKEVHSISVACVAHLLCVLEHAKTIPLT